MEDSVTSQGWCSERGGRGGKADMQKVKILDSPRVQGEGGDAEGVQVQEAGRARPPVIYHGEHVRQWRAAQPAPRIPGSIGPYPLYTSSMSIGYVCLRPIPHFSYSPAALCLLYPVLSVDSCLHAKAGLSTMRGGRVVG